MSSNVCAACVDLAGSNCLDFVLVFIDFFIQNADLDAPLRVYLVYKPKLTNTIYAMINKAFHLEAVPKTGY